MDTKDYNERLDKFRIWIADMNYKQLEQMKVDLERRIRYQNESRDVLRKSREMIENV